MSPESQHLLLDLWLKDNTESTVDQICDYVSFNFNVVKKISYDFVPQGRTIVYILSESHFSVHTYPEHNYITLDIYICNMNIDMQKVAADILRICKPLKYATDIIIRGD